MRLSSANGFFKFRSCSRSLFGDVVGFSASAMSKEVPADTWRARLLNICMTHKHVLDPASCGSDLLAATLRFLWTELWSRPTCMEHGYALLEALRPFLREEHFQRLQVLMIRTAKCSPSSGYSTSLTVPLAHSPREQIELNRHEHNLVPRGRRTLSPRELDQDAARVIFPPYPAEVPGSKEVLDRLSNRGESSTISGYLQQGLSRITKTVRKLSESSGEVAPSSQRLNMDFKSVAASVDASSEQAAPSAATTESVPNLVVSKAQSPPPDMIAIGSHPGSVADAINERMSVSPISAKHGKHIHKLQSSPLRSKSEARQTQHISVRS